MKLYQCHKLVHAAKVAGIEFHANGSAVIAAKDGEIVSAKAGWRDRFKGELLNGPEDLGYYVRYDDGYESWSPTKAFEEGYTEIA